MNHSNSFRIYFESGTLFPQPITSQEFFSLPGITSSNQYDEWNLNISFSCCQSDRLLDFVPISCFEQNGCRGLQWLGDEACAPSILNSIEDKKLGKTPQTDTITKEPILEQNSPTELIMKNTENVRSSSEVEEFSDFIVVKLKTKPLIKRFKLKEIPNTSVDVTFDKFTR